MKLKQYVIRTVDPSTQQILNQQVQRPRNIRNNQLGPYVQGDHVQIIIKKNGQQTDYIQYVVDKPVPQNKRIYGCRMIDFVQMNWSTSQSQPTIA